MDDRTLSVRLKPDKYGEIEKRARAEGRTVAGYARARLFDDDLRVFLKEINERLKTVEQLLRHENG